MVFDWQDYYRCAQFLKDYTGDAFTRETALRCAVSRAYYAAFHHALNYACDRLGYKPTGFGSDHSGLRRHLRDKRTAGGVVGYLARLQEWREHCDYKDEVVNLDSIV